MASKLAEKTPGWIERILLPQLSEIKGELRAINSRIDSTNTKIEEMDKRLSAEIREMDKRLSSEIREMDKRLSSEIKEMDARLTSEIREMDKRLTSEIQNLHELVNLSQRVTILEAKQREFEKKSS